MGFEPFLPNTFFSQWKIYCFFLVVCKQMKTFSFFVIFNEGQEESVINRKEYFILLFYSLDHFYRSFFKCEGEGMFSCFICCFSRLLCHIFWTFITFSWLVLRYIAPSSASDFFCGLTRPPLA